ncbi:MAG: hypothetical protein K8F62_17860 [Pseudorhodoplanes sp.]|nr:hypothetical protein [Pseudorhodoplanes sp.]
MTGGARTRARRETVALTRAQAAAILIKELGCADIEADIFWSLASDLQQDGAR